MAGKTPARAAIDKSFAAPRFFVKDVAVLAQQIDMPKRFHRSWVLVSTLWLGLCACSASGGSHVRVGTEPGRDSGATDFGNSDAGLPDTGTAASSNALNVHVENPAHMTISVVTLACAGDCADVEAVAHDGHPPYAFSWEDGSTDSKRHVCPTASSRFAVSVTDTAIDSIEFPYAAHSASAMITASVLACGQDASIGTLDGGGVLAENLIVPGVSDIWLAGQPDGTSLVGADTNPDITPICSPVMVPVVAGSTLTFAVSGATSNTGGLCYSTTPDGGCFTSLAIAVGPANGLSSLSVSLNALVGVFMSDALATDPAPAAIDPSTTFTTLSPLLNQTFVIGDGLTGTGTGSVQQFVVPATATRLFLASSDGAGASYNNAGQFSVTVTAL